MMYTCIFKSVTQGTIYTVSQIAGSALEAAEAAAGIYTPIAHDWIEVWNGPTRELIFKKQCVPTSWVSAAHHDPQRL